MLNTNRFLNKLDFYMLLDKLAALAILPVVKKQILSLQPLNGLDEIKEELTKVDEMLQIVSRHMRAPIMISSDYDEIIKLLTKGATLTGLELVETVKLFTTVKSNQKYAADLIKEEISSIYYQKQVSLLKVNEKVYQDLEKNLDEKGSFLDGASPTLKMVRKKMALLEQNVKQRLQDLINKESAKLSSTSIVIRDDCYCLAVKSEYKNSIKGIIHDFSASMQTTFIEPLVASQMMADKNRLQEEEKAEINRLLKQYSDLLRDDLEIISTDFMIIKELDLLFAKAILAKSYDGYLPHLNQDGYLDLKKARHPLLNVPKVIPNNISFGKGYLGLIVTGPNTGGKTVLLKTVGLLCLMVKYGLLIPADASSNVMIFDQIFCDIGDDQSITSNLSTFSSHMQNIKEIIDLVTPKSLVLFDEIGAGTDPIEGANLAKAILKYLIKKNVSFITTTHYSDLKSFGFATKEVINASMEFDQNTLSPTYNLRLGISGASNAFNIAKRLGLKNEIIQDAISMNAESNDEVLNLITKLEQTVKLYDDKYQDLNRKLQEVEDAKKLYAEKELKIEKEKALIINKAHEEARNIIQKVQAKARAILDEAKKFKNNQTKLHEEIAIKHKIKDLDEMETPLVVKENEPDFNLNVNDDVYLKSYNQYGVVQKVLKDDHYVIGIGNLTLTLPKEDLRPIKHEKKLEISNNFTTINKTRANISLSLDLRGKRYEEAKALLDKYLDDLVLTGIKQATIIHGYGTGVIRELVQSFLKNNQNIASYRYGGETEGGFGVTVINLK